MTPTTNADWPSLLRTWGSLGDTSVVSHKKGLADWDAANRMIDAVGPMLGAERERLKVLLAESRARLAPLEDPFDLDLGLHRWLDADREEAYSDWLQWVVQQARMPEPIYRLFGLGTPPADLPDCPPEGIRRECCIPHGHEERTGRLDLVIRFGDRAIIVVEVKIGDAEAADTVKQKGYARWIARQACPEKHCVLLATSAEEAAYEGFTFVSWQSLSLEMRRLAVEMKDEKRTMAAAMILAFVAAVEQNLLGFSADLVRRICEGSASFFNPKVVDHMERFLKP
jgi:hypothetical protein